MTPLPLLRYLIDMAILTETPLQEGQISETTKPLETEVIDTFDEVLNYYRDYSDFLKDYKKDESNRSPSEKNYIINSQALFLEKQQRGYEGLIVNQMMGFLDEQIEMYNAVLKQDPTHKGDKGMLEKLNSQKRLLEQYIKEDPETKVMQFFPPPELKNSSQQQEYKLAVLGRTNHVRDDLAPRVGQRTDPCLPSVGAPSKN